MRRKNTYTGLLFLLVFTALLSCSTDSKTLSLNPSSLSFGNVHLGDFLEKDIVVKNKYGKDILITNVDVTGSNDFVISSATVTPINLLNNNSITIKIKFTPSIAGPNNSTLSIIHDASTKAKTLNISGEGVAVP
ncbi:MAG: choice-of-anchor D domain-containing protein, partial [Planctomycetes bacterium]|nr:choice-of-anchor D domain-containing protein [Planctomycetota bacterium]